MAVGDGPGLAAAIGAALADPTHAAAMGAAGRQQVADVLDPDRLVAGVEAVYRAALAVRRLAPDARRRRWPRSWPRCWLPRPRPAAMARAATPRADRVLIVSYPGLTWAGVAAADAPALLGLLGQSAAASMSVQTATDHTTAPDGYLTVGAGNRADARLGPGAPSVAAMPTADGFLVPAAEALRAHNDDLLYGAKPGALGTALGRSTGTRAAVVGEGVAALAVMDATGRRRRPGRSGHGRRRRVSHRGRLHRAMAAGRRGARGAARPDGVGRRAGGPAGRSRSRPRPGPGDRRPSHRTTVPSSRSSPWPARAPRPAGLAARRRAVRAT